MPIIIRVIDHERTEVEAVAFGPIDYAEVEKHLLEERTLEGLAYKEFIDARGGRTCIRPKPDRNPSDCWTDPESQSAIEIWSHRRTRLDRLCLRNYACDGNASRGCYRRETLPSRKPGSLVAGQHINGTVKR